MAKLKKSNPEGDGLVEADGNAENQGNPEVNSPAEAYGKAEVSGCPRVPEMLKPLEM